ncbi:MAG: hypothetical protein AAF567_12725 [Actinomycetota bacterium]
MSIQSMTPLEELDSARRASMSATAERYGCGARTADERRACALYLWLLGPTKEQLRVNCPCRE